MRMIGIGTDIVKVDRIASICKKNIGNAFLSRIFTTKERDALWARSRSPDYFNHIAGRFAAKEAVFKSISGSMAISWHDVAILSHPDDTRPLVEFTAGVTAKVLLSISHEKEYAVATAIAYEC